MAIEGCVKVTNKAVFAREAALFHEDAVHWEAESLSTAEQSESYSQDEVEVVQGGQTEG